MIPTTEALLCTPLGFDLRTATSVQRARCRIGDGLPLDELRGDPDVIVMVGGPEAIEALPSEQGIAPAMVVDVSSIRSAKTMMACCRAARAVFAVNVTGCRIGEVPRIPIFSLKLSRSRVAFRMLCALFGRPALAPLVVSQTAESLIVRSPSGVPIELACVAGGRSAQDFVGDWLAGVIADEAPRMLGRDEGVTNLADVLTALHGRMLPHAQVQPIGTSWAPHGPIYDLVNENFGRPSARVVVLRSTGPMNNPAHFTPAMCSEMEAADPVAYATSVMGEFADPETGLLSPMSVRKNTRETPLELPQGPGVYAAGIDPSEGGARNSFTVVIVKLEHEVVVENGKRIARPHWRGVLAREFRGLGVAASWHAVAETLERYGINHAVTDGFSAGASVALAATCGIRLTVQRLTAQSKLEAYSSLATLVHTDRIELPPHREFLRDLKSIKKRTTQSGQVIHLPQTSDGRHCDFAPALIAAMHGIDHVAAAETRRRRIELIDEQMRAHGYGDGEHARGVNGVVGRNLLDREGRVRPVSFGGGGAGWQRPEERKIVGYRKKYVGGGLEVNEPVYEGEKDAP